jgi:hypothetical protein
MPSVKVISNLSACLLLGMVTACGTAGVSADGHKLYRIPTSSWRPGNPSQDALMIGTLASGIYKGHWCPWLDGPGPHRTPIVWPAGYRAERHPLKLLDSRGKVVAQGGERIKLGGGNSPVKQDDCLLGQDTEFVVMSQPIRE